MPYAIDDSKMQQGSDNQLMSLDPDKPPVKQIPILEFPRVLYKHPREPFRTIEHRNNKHEVVHTELVPAEHLTLRVEDKAEQTKALKDGWVLEAYVAPPLPDPNASLYDK